MIIVLLCASCSGQLRLPSAAYKTGKKGAGKERNNSGQAAKGEVRREYRTEEGDRTVGGTLLANYAAQIGVGESDLQNPELYAMIDEWMGVPHRTGGMSKSGIDCSGFAYLVMQDVYGKEIPRISYEQAQLVKRKYEDQLVEGDLVFFSFENKKIDHVGVYLANRKFVHASTSSGVMISDLNDTWYYRYFVRCGSVR